MPASLKVIELRRYYSQGFNVWVVVYPPDYDWPARTTHLFGKRVSKGDLVLVYEWWPRRWFRQIYTVTSDAEARRKDGRYVHSLRRICSLEPPLHVKALEADPLIPVDDVFGQKFNRKITDHWWRVYELLVRKYPDCAKALAKFSPTRV